MPNSAVLIDALQTCRVGLLYRRAEQWICSNDE